MSTWVLSIQLGTTPILWSNNGTPNVIEIEGLLFLGFGQVLANVRAPWKTGFSHQVTSRGSSKMELFS